MGARIFGVAFAFLMLFALAGCITSKAVWYTWDEIPTIEDKNLPLAANPMTPETEKDFRLLLTERHNKTEFDDFSKDGYEVVRVLFNDDDWAEKRDGNAGQQTRNIIYILKGPQDHYLIVWSSMWRRVNHHPITDQIISTSSAEARIPYADWKEENWSVFRLSAEQAKKFGV